MALTEPPAHCSNMALGMAVLVELSATLAHNYWIDRYE